MKLFNTYKILKARTIVYIALLFINDKTTILGVYFDQLSALRKCTRELKKVGKIGIELKSNFGVLKFKVKGKNPVEENLKFLLNPGNTKYKVVKLK